MLRSVYSDVDFERFGFYILPEKALLTPKAKVGYRITPAITHTGIVMLSGSMLNKKPRFTTRMSTEAPIPAQLPHDGKRFPPLSPRDTNNTQTGNTNQVPYVPAPSMSPT